MKILFMGTPAFSIPSLRGLLEAGHEVVSIYTRPDRPRGRGLRPSPSPVKQFALANDLPVHHPERLRDRQEWDRVGRFAPDVIVVVAYGKILPEEMLGIPRLGAINVHASLLPRHRGAAPIAWSLLAGDKETGVSTMVMDAGMDTGAVLLQKRCEILPEETTGELSVRLSALGAGLLVETLDRLERGEIEPVPQDSTLATNAPKIKTEDARIEWGNRSSDIARRIRAFNPAPGAFTECKGKRIQIWKAAPCTPPPGAHKEEAGRLLELAGETGLLSCGGGSCLKVEEIQPEGGARMTFGAFARGRRLQAGERFGEV
ncbi:MAG: methionyl-tRNA formyltransferase [Acidobacteria bacterium]|nr:methionyl-tRNA formyltransferase [Acidobacteriota bacterium]